MTSITFMDESFHKMIITSVLLKASKATQAICLELHSVSIRLPIHTASFSLLRIKKVALVLIRRHLIRALLILESRPQTFQESTIMRVHSNRLWQGRGELSKFTMEV